MARWRAAVPRVREAPFLGRDPPPSKDPMPAPLARRTPMDVESIEQLVESARRYVAQGKAKSTRRAYRSSFAGFDGWCTSRGLCSCPAPPPTVAVYLAALADAGAAVATIEKMLAAIAHEHRSRGFVWPRGEPAVRETMAGIRRTIGTSPTTKKAPVSDDELVRLVATLGEDLAGLRDRALLTLGWSSACRRFELVALDVADVEHKTEGLLVHVRRSKNDQEAKGLDKGVPFASSPALCAVRAVRAWLDAAGIKDGALFRAVDKHGHVAKTRLSDRSVARIVQRAALAAGLDPTRYGGHSLRSGFMTTAAEKGRPLEAIMRQTGHKSERVARGYIQHATVFINNPAKGLV
jgi:integrase